MTPYAPNYVTLEFGDGSYLFKLPLAQLAELQEKCHAGIGTIFARVMTANYHVEDIYETIRLGLVGGGEGLVNGQTVQVTAPMARALVERYCPLMPLELQWDHARVILSAVVQGYEPEGETETKKKDAAATAGSTSPRHTGTVQ